ncbi:MAG: hypothetical protein WC794_00050 [Candidatus Doudnabacteria bacterium]
MDVWIYFTKKLKQKKKTACAKAVFCVHMFADLPAAMMWQVYHGLYLEVDP